MSGHSAMRGTLTVRHASFTQRVQAAATAGLDQAVPVKVDRRESGTPAYPLRRQAYAHDDDSGVVAALRRHSSTDPNCVPIVVKLRRTLGEHWLAVNACNSANLGVN